VNEVLAEQDNHGGPDKRDLHPVHLGERPATAYNPDRGDTDGEQTTEHDENTPGRQDHCSSPWAPDEHDSAGIMLPSLPATTHFAASSPRFAECPGGWLALASIPGSAPLPCRGR